MKLPLEAHQALLTRGDRRNFERLCLHVAENGRDTVGLVGAGVSQSRYTSWRGLLSQLHDKARRRVARSRDASAKRELSAAAQIDDPLIKAGVYEALLGSDRFRAFLAQRFASKRVTRAEGLPAAVVRLPFRYVFTTNYDDTLERTYQFLRSGLRASELGLHAINWSNPRDVEQLLANWGKADGRWYIHLHGTAAKPRSMILTERDYTERYVRSDVTTRTLLTLLAFRTVVCLGFSLSDVDLMQVLRHVKALRGRAVEHFALLGLERDDWHRAERRRVEYAEKYGVHPIFYRVGPDGSHGGLLPLLNHMAYHGAEEQLRMRSAQESQPPLKRIESVVRKAWRDPLIADDPNKGLFGGLDTRNGRRLSATVSVAGDNYYWITLKVEAIGNGTPLTGAVTFYTHTSFPRHLWRIRERPKRSVARTKFWVWGGFTVGAVVEVRPWRLSSI
jgi:hypothetical protein